MQDGKMLLLCRYELLPEWLRLILLCMDFNRDRAVSAGKRLSLMQYRNQETYYNDVEMSSTGAVENWVSVDKLRSSIATYQAIGLWYSAEDKLIQKLNQCSIL